MNTFSEHPPLRSAKLLLAVLALLFAVVWLYPLPSGFEGLAEYQQLHIAVETLSIVISMLVFGVAWNAYSRERPSNTIILATGLLATGLLDFAHMMSYAGMPAWVTPSGPEKAINFWLVARLVFAVALLVVALRPWAPFRNPATRYRLLVAALGFSALCYWVGLYHPDILPHTFIKGQGLTHFKVNAEYFIVILLVVVTVLFWRQARQAAIPEAAGLFAAAGITVLSELSFTLYSDVTDVFNLLGHFYKVLAYLYVYRTVFVGSVHEPFRRVQHAEAALREANQRFQATFEQAAVGIAMLSSDGKTMRTVNQRLCEITGYTEAELLALDYQGLSHPDDLTEDIEFTRQLLSGEIDHYSRELRLVRKDQSVIWVNRTRSLVRNVAGQPDYFVSIIQDIQDKKAAEISLRHLNRALRTLSSCNRSLVHATTEAELLEDMCRNIVETGGHLLAWVGYARHDAEKSVQPVAAHAVQPGYLDSLAVSWAEDVQAGQGPVGTAIRIGKTQIIQYIASDPLMAPWRDKALTYGYQTCISLPLHKNGIMIGALTIYAAEVDAFDKAEVALLEELAGDMSYGIASLHMRSERDTAVAEHQDALEKLSAVLQDTVQAIAATVEMRDPYTAGHQRRVADLAASIGGELGWSHERIFALHLAGVVHDLGKISLPAEILSKPGRLNEIEYTLVKQHPQTGYDILKVVDFPWPLAQYVLQHHERLDGSGYPNGLQGGEILLEARILAVADVVEAMSSHRPYRPGLGVDAALAEIEKNRGTLYDADVVDATLRLFREQGYQFESQA